MEQRNSQSRLGFT